MLKDINVILNGTSLDDYKPEEFNFKNMISPESKKIKFVFDGIPDTLFNQSEKKIMERIEDKLFYVFNSVFYPKNIGNDIIVFVEIDWNNNSIYIDCLNRPEFIEKEPKEIFNIMNKHKMFKRFYSKIDNYEENEYKQLWNNYNSTMIYNLIC